MSERIDFNNIAHNDLRLKNWERSEISGHNDIQVDIDRLIPLTERHPVTKKTLTELAPQLDHECWSYETEEIIEDSQELKISTHTITPRTVVEIILAEGAEAAQKNHPHLTPHIEKIMTADRRYPLFMYEDHVLNGMHRLAQVYIEQQRGGMQDFVTIKELKTIPPEAIIND